jgi:hypothetical protein
MRVWYIPVVVCNCSAQESLCALMIKRAQPEYNKLYPKFRTVVWHAYVDQQPGMHTVRVVTAVYFELTLTSRHKAVGFCISFSLRKFMEDKCILNMVGQHGEVSPITFTQVNQVKLIKCC